MSRSTATTIMSAFAFWLIFEALVFLLAPLNLGLPPVAQAALFGGVLSVVMLFTTQQFLRFDIITMADLGLVPNRGSAARFALSLVIGIAFFGVFFLLYLVLTPIEILNVPNANFANVAILSLLVMIALGTMEEIVFRGYFLHKLDRVFGIRGAIYTTSIAFGLYHGVALDSLMGPAIWGLFYGVLAYWSKGLAVPIGFHVGVNVIQAMFHQKTRWLDGYWTFDVTNTSAVFSIEQVTVGIQVILLVGGVLLVEYYVRKIHPKA